MYLELKKGVYLFLYISLLHTCVTHIKHIIFASSSKQHKSENEK